MNGCDYGGHEMKSIPWMFPSLMSGDSHGDYEMVFNALDVSVLMNVAMVTMRWTLIDLGMLAPVCLGSQPSIVSGRPVNNYLHPI
jgi:hypothetical protein